MLKFFQDLFRHLILQSSSFYDVSYHLHSAEVASQLAGLLLSSLECEETSQAECLRSASLADIMTAGLQVESRTDNWGWDVEGRQCQVSGQLMFRSTWMPVTDFTYSASPFLPDHPHKLITEGAFPTEVSVIIGRTEDEGIIYLTGNLIQHYTQRQFYVSMYVLRSVYCEYCRGVGKQFIMG